MTAVLVLSLVLSLTALVVMSFVLGHRYGGDRWQAELTRVRLEAAQAERQLHDLSRTAFAAMAEEVERHRFGRHEA